MTYEDNPHLDAIAWFIIEDETNCGGDWERKNEYWLTGRRVCYRQFSSWEEVVERSQRHAKVIAESEGMTEEYEDDFRMNGKPGMHPTS